MSSATGTRSVNNFYDPDDRLFSFFGRLNYDYKGKYMFSATMRADGSSKFAKDNQWGYFPSAAVSWRLSGEEWMKDITWIDNLKLRYSYGTAGNNNIPSGLMLQEYAGNDNASNWYLYRQLVGRGQGRRRQDRHGQSRSDVGDDLLAQPGSGLQLPARPDQRFGGRLPEQHEGPADQIPVDGQRLRVSVPQTWARRATAVSSLLRRSCCWRSRTTV